MVVEIVLINNGFVYKQNSGHLGQVSTSMFCPLRLLCFKHLQLPYGSN